eukprot:CAMPEP_0172450400 /NCGR_PEP_ID=MMETSP1065-20121228/8752_1 /TAXON_ID=265537 /ORGANISM="Amphiprora paludosa, Strain CCMP125" /LENGTH=275 /DNA_ID=CAMNT_0013202179 /DNA_START=114 /DNA_END=941 /DNA_ORIENTATION=+
MTKTVPINNFVVESSNKEFVSQQPLSMASTADNEDMTEEQSWEFNPLFASLWLGFVTFAIVGPGEFNAPSDIELLNNYIANPSDPGFSEAFQVIFNYLGIMPMILACLAVPQGARKGLPALPFMSLAFAMGYGTIGPYLSFRAPPTSTFDPSEASWFTKNVLDNKLLGAGLVAGVIGLPVALGLVGAYLQDPAATVQGYTDLFASSKFVSASSMDAVVLNIAAAALIPRDLKLRIPDIEDSKAKLIGASTLLLPFLGAALYCALRPSLPSEDYES